MAQFDFLAVGDIVTEPFIRLKDARVHCNMKDEDCEICMRWGDKIPYESATPVVAVGNAPNAAVSAARLGLISSLQAYVGEDEQGKECIEVLKKEGVDTSLMVIEKGKQTNHHFVLWYEDERTILVKHEEFNYQLPRLVEEPQWMYLSSLSDNSLPYQEAWAAQLELWKGTKLAFQPGTFQIKLGTQSLKKIYKRTDVFFCNKQEAEHITGNPSGSEVKTLLEALQKLGPKTVVMTDDTRGAYARAESGEMYHCPRYPDPRPPFEITGAGDAFASTTTAALALGKELPEALRWGATNASAVLQEIGAQKGLLTREELEQHLTNPPQKFEVEKIT